MPAGEQLGKLWTSLAGLGPGRLMALAAVGIAIFATVGFGSYFLSRPNLELLYQGLQPSEVPHIGSVLNESGIMFDVSADETKIMVKRGEAARARMVLAERGLPSGTTAGYELFDKLGSMGLTSFMQNITRLRALEGEIARSVQSMKGVKAARVHLVLPDPATFRRAPEPASASVVVRTDMPEFTSAGAIRQLVSSAVPGLSPEHVSVMTTDGTILSAGGEMSGGVASGKMLDLEKQVAREINENIRRTLAPFLGHGNFETSVSARLNTDKKQTSEVNYDPETKVERSTRTVKETSSALTANPKWNVSVEQNVPQGDQGNGLKPSEQSRHTTDRKEETTNFEMSQKTVTTVSDGYRIENIAVAVVVNRKQLAAGTAADELVKSIEKLVASAAGLVPARGDKVTVAAVDFAAGKDLEPVSAPSFWEQMASQAGSYIIAAAIFLSVMIFVSLGLRPTVRLLTESKQPEEAVNIPQIAAEFPPALQAEPEFAGEPQQLEAPELPPAPKKPSLIKIVEKVIDENEKHAAEIIREWLTEG